MDDSSNFREKGYPISDELWKVLVCNKPLKDAEVLYKREAILHFISIGIDIVRGDGRILGYNAKNDRFYDSMQYMGQENHGPMNHLAKIVAQGIAGMFIFGLTGVAARYFLWKNNLPMTPAMMEFLPLPVRLEYLEKEAARMDSINAARI
ncbi:hypothetical protein PEC18_04825 [Paucibacter sp. O1-1]|nr:hypothetical protein [Paucibacter sp. O1-1]MDA3825195.1 hypothetical protein [Paucibacter sp. O1-1]